MLAQTQRLRGQFAADICVHVLGLLLGSIGATVLVARAMGGDGGNAVLPVLIYAVSLMAMLGFSAAYNLSPAGTPLLRRLDHAAIFVMIAGTYTPFTVRVFDGAAATAFTAIVWAVALAGAAAKLAVPHLFERRAIFLYLALGWAILAAFGPIVAALDSLTVGLLAAGGILYSVGVAFYLWHTLPFQRAIWHLFVVAAAGCHYAAIFRSIA
jgi:hemolysin III